MKRISFLCAGLLLCLPFAVRDRGAGPADVGPGIRLEDSTVCGPVTVTDRVECEGRRYFAIGNFHLADRPQLAVAVGAASATAEAGFQPAAIATLACRGERAETTPAVATDDGGESRTVWTADCKVGAK